MAELSKITLPNGSVYDLKDATARSIGKVSGVKGNSESTYRTGDVNITATNIGLGNLTNNKQVKGLSSGTTNNNLVAWGSDGYTVADSGIAKGSVATKLALSGTNYSASSNTITVTKANLQSAVQDSDLVLMTAAERTKLASIETGGNYVTVGGTQTVTGAKTFSAPIVVTNSMRIGFVAAGTTVGDYSFTSGDSCSASGRFAHGEGKTTHAEGNYSHAEGYLTYAIGYGSHAEGNQTKAYGDYSHSEGDSSEAYGDYSYVSGLSNYATEDYQTVIGKYNSVSIDDSGDEPVYDAGNYAFIIGNGYYGNDSPVRSNALTVDWNGGIKTYNSNLIVGTPPASDNTNMALCLADKNGTRMGDIDYYYSASDVTGICMTTYRKINETNHYNSFRLTIDSSGNKGVYINQPAAWRSALGLDEMINVDGKQFISKSPTITIGTAPSSNYYFNGFTFRDKTNVSVGSFQLTYFTNNQSGVTMESQRTVNGTTRYNSLRLLQDASGNSIVSLDAAAWRSALQLNNILDLFRVTSFSKTNFSIGANTTATAAISFTVPSGFTAVSIVNTRCDATGTTSSANLSNCFCYNSWISGTTANVSIRNIASSAAKITVYAYILFDRNTL